MTSLIIRADSKTNKPVAFVADSIDKGQMLAWPVNAKSGPEITGIDYYQTTKTVDASTAQNVAQKYAKQFGEEDVQLRQRLPRNFREGVTVVKVSKPLTPKPVKVANSQVDVQALAKQIAAAISKAMKK